VCGLRILTANNSRKRIEARARRRQRRGRERAGLLERERDPSLHDFRNDRLARLFDRSNHAVHPSWNCIVLRQSPPDRGFPLSYSLRRETHVSLAMCHDKHSHGDNNLCVNPMKIVIRFPSITAKISHKSVPASMKMSKKSLLTIYTFRCHEICIQRSCLFFCLVVPFLASHSFVSWGSW